MILDDYLEATRDANARKKLEKAICKSEKDVLKLAPSYAYWQNSLLERTLTIFEYENLPFPQKELEKRLLIDGYCGIVDDKKAGLACTRGGLFGVTPYEDEFTSFIYAGPVFEGGTERINETCAIINNTSMRSSILPMINRYASLLAHAELSTKSAMIALRRMETYSVEDSNTLSNVEKYFDKLYQGDYSAIVDRSLTLNGSIQNIGSNKVNETSAMQAWELRQQLFRAYLNEIGIKVASDKKERMVVEEVSADAMYLLMNIHDMRKQREEGLKIGNDIFGLQMKVKLNPEFQYLTDVPRETSEKEGENDEN